VIALLTAGALPLLGPDGTIMFPPSLAGPTCTTASLLVVGPPDEHRIDAYCSVSEQAAAGAVDAGRREARSARPAS
jgi:hypothetical protein